jgi:predicted transcriptional regulator
MPMGVVSSKDFKKELENSSVPQEDIVLEMERPGRSKGDNNVPNNLRKLIGLTAIEEGRQSALQLAEAFGVSPSSVSAYTEGATSTATIGDKPNAPIIDDAKKRIAKKASTVLHRALDNLTDDKLQATKAVELAQIAKSMSGVVKDMEPESDGNGNKQEPIFQVYAPQIRQENHYETIVVRE